MYTELHLHTSFSLLDGASQPEELVLRAKELGYKALAVTDHDSLGGAMEFAQACVAAGIQPITGAEITLSDGSHITLLAETRQGYGNLCRLLTDIKHGWEPAPVQLHGDPETISTTTNLGSYAEGLILLTGCKHSQLSSLAETNQPAKAKRVLAQYVEWFGRESVFIELQHHRTRGDTQRMGRLVALSQSTGVPTVITGNVHYHRRERHFLQDVMVAIKQNTTLDGCHRLRRANGMYYLRSPEEMAERFASAPEAVANTEVIARRCAAFNLTEDLGYSFPDFDNGMGLSADEQLSRLCWNAFQERYPGLSPDDSRPSKQLREELELIRKHQLSGFFLVYADLLRMATEIADDIRGYQRSSRHFLPPGRGRGSAVSSIVCYLIGLSPVDPLRHNLYVGRFLNDNMKSVPDIDIDFPREIRERMIERVYSVYGRDYAAMVSAYATYRLPSAVRDIGKALGLPQHDIDRIARVAEPRSATELGTELAKFPEYASRLQEPPWSYLITLATQLAKHPRHISQHSGGMVISSNPLNEIVPIQPAAMEGRFICQWDKDSVADAGLIKIDFLALGMLSQVEECLDLIDSNQGKTIDLSRIDYDDKAVYRMIQRGDTIGTFQIESRAQIQMVQRTKPENLDDLVVQVAIVRPGPIIGGAVTPFVQRRIDPNFVPSYDHPLLEPVLEETLGVVLYQEQVIQVAEVLAGFTSGQADQFRRAMTRKRSIEAMAAMKGEFIEGCLRNGVPLESAEAVYPKLAGFAEYGFPKSHAAAFGLLAYQSSWLKHYYPAEFLCALLNNQPMGFYAPHVLINDARRKGTRVLRPDINLSNPWCSVEGKRTVRIGLALVAEVKEDLADRIVIERETNGLYQSLSDLFRRVPMRPAAMEALIGSGALDDFGLQRREMLWQLGLYIPARTFREGRKGIKTAGVQLSLELPTKQDHVELPRTTAWERVQEAYRTLGFSLQQHPMSLLRLQLPKHLVSSRELRELPSGYPVYLPGLVVCRQRPETAKGITFLSLEDEVGLANVIVYPDLYKEQRTIIRSSPFVIVQGRLQREGANINIIATRFEPIDERIGQGQPPRPRWDEEDDRTDNADVQLLVFDRDEALTQADVLSVKPASHNYR